MISPTRMSQICRSRTVAAFTVVFALAFTLNCGVTQGQEETDSTAGVGSTFQPEEVDQSAFSGIERTESIGSTGTQGFGLAPESSTGRATGGIGGGGGGLGGLGGLFGALGGAFGGQGASTQKPLIRVRLRSAITLPPGSADSLQRSAAVALSYAPQRSGVQGVNVTMDRGTAILTGAVRTEKDRRMSELLMRLEPGVRQVDNRVVVGN